MDRLQVSWLRELERSITGRRLLSDGQKILVAVSGGLDSMTLLHALRQLAPAHRWQLTVAHFNHQLRGRAANGDERLVRKTALALKLPFVTGQADVRAEARREGISLEMAGRKLRHAFLAKTARARGVPVIALAHHADDQVELFFLRLLRGTGGQGLGGMKWASPSPADASIWLVRPLLGQSKTALREAARAAGIRFSEDATNAQIEIERNRIRHVLIPSLQKYCPALTETVPRLMELAGADANVVTDLAERWLKAKRRTRFTSLPVAVQRRVIQLQLFALKETPTFDLVERLRANPGAPFSLADKRIILRDPAGMIHARQTEITAFNPARQTLLLKGVKGRAQIESLTIHWQIERKSGATFRAEPNAEYFDADKVGPQICLRHWQAGDCFQPIGASSPRKLQDLFTNTKVPRSERHCRVVATTNRDEPFWVEGLRIADPFKLAPSTTRRLKWQWARD
ncbi:MAG TPA: tRNA lysidine(34) synthetase TilS [Verrucomicrobiae bacterium]|jgi:tRNA(Ile)-lysidine synthase|nr:tRNA lysidine(34) synthetase TilS [Verrucomicrobiae bacterium]